MSDEVNAFDYMYILKDLTTASSSDMVNKDRESIVAYIGINNMGGQNVYYIRCRGGVVFDPFDKSVSNTRKSNLWKLCKTNKQAYDAYISYLKTKRKVFKFQAERNI